MIETDGKIRLTSAEFNRLRQAAARRGHAVNGIKTAEDYENALVRASAPAFIDDLLEALETGSSRLIRGEVDFDQLLEG
jgi:hypothetical protein